MAVLRVFSTWNKTSDYFVNISETKSTTLFAFRKVQRTVCQFQQKKGKAPKTVMGL